MSEEMNDAEALLDRATAQIADCRPDDAQAKAAAARVWDRLASESADAAAQAAEIDEIRGCDDYQALIPAYLADALPEARKLLLEDHTRECLPCRRALKIAREGEAPAKTWHRKEPEPTSSWRSYKVWALAAALIAGIGVAQFLVRELVPFGLRHQRRGRDRRWRLVSHRRDLAPADQPGRRRA